MASYQSFDPGRWVICDFRLNLSASKRFGWTHSATKSAFANAWFHWGCLDLPLLGWPSRFRKARRWLRAAIRFQINILEFSRERLRASIRYAFHLSCQDYMRKMAAESARILAA